MTKDRLLTEGECERVYYSPKSVSGTTFRMAIAEAQDAKTLEALRPVIEWTTRGPCLGSFSAPVPCGHCATCQARAVLAEMNAQGKGKEG